MGSNCSRLQDDFSTYRMHTRIKGFGGEIREDGQEEEEGFHLGSTSSRVLKSKKRGSSAEITRVGTFLKIGHSLRDKPTQRGGLRMAIGHQMGSKHTAAQDF